MKNLIRALVVLAVAFFITGCYGIKVESNLGSSPLFHYGEKVWVVNGLKHEIEIVYRTWGKEHVKRRFSPGQDGVITGLRNGEHLLARVYNHDGEVIGTTIERIRKRHDSQVWEIKRYHRLH